MEGPSLMVNAARLRAQALALAQRPLITEAAAMRLDDLATTLAEWAAELDLPHDVAKTFTDDVIVIREAVVAAQRASPTPDQRRVRFASEEEAASPVDEDIELDEEQDLNWAGDGSVATTLQGAEDVSAVGFGGVAQNDGLRHRRRLHGDSQRAALAELLQQNVVERDLGDGAAAQAEQEALLKDMASMVGQLKAAAQGQGKVIEEQVALAEEVGESTAKAVDAMDTVNDTLSEQIKRSGGCWMWSLLISIFLSFGGMILFIKLTNLNPFGGRS